ncbi:DUF397 domain-containing protein [Nocardia cyriacigeorgica]|uniref:DUF397 domain-containing protein n=1 Tax=Nocardia cyriacigeorgica TaxID=135487 RepID=UPI00189454FE|nr:DUF397 domain-containing protein [Nocardia cyriacigeorgica]MBF6438696.1 DUF397 domain-containing protein [Nocardia cyriacigeorgica]MBF6456604.1 DUF397 domain-containing protein [Nocardia cyriacigeorgica]MBF6478545.1 DUF397 domain-containing protein [Nocardia cyriacigeorgica]MBF6551409.1 DUF397 domain-containing protein [Nocardia cyriacigeorgica]
MSIDLASAHWFKSTYSQGAGECVEVAFLGNDFVGVRDSKNPMGPALAFAPSVWRTFTTAITNGRFTGA